MLVISRKKDEAVLIGDNIEVKVVGVDGNNIKLAISAPNNISILRKEIYEKVKNENIKATNKNIKILKTTSITLIIMPLLLTVPILLNFEKSFIIFHKLLFSLYHTLNSYHIIVLLYCEFFSYEFCNI